MLTYKVVSAVAAMGLSAAVVLALPGFSPEADASTPPKVVKGDRLDLRPIGKNCAQQAWPYFEADCLRGRAGATGPARSIRLITTDRVAAR